ncbi:RuvX/YqgF family protein [Blattabacterium cuenoti]|uniref:RuvX/YqgF family protein n=1 Tax=Blattabacterium cuenoti TaxID=1653831 RepID=UPI00163C8BE4|nr:RuvX/YqgF family protein [Blattabacterium cuenoti]
MAKILGIDYGKVITGLSISDEKKIFAFGLEAIPTKNLMKFFSLFFSSETIEKVIIGLPKKWNNQPEILIEKYIQKFIYKFRIQYPKVLIERLDERYTSKIAFHSMIELGLKKKVRRKKTILNQISAILILQSYLSQQEKCKKN